MIFNKKNKPYTELLGKTNRIVEGTTIKGDIVSKSDMRLDGNLEGNLNCTGKVVIGPSSIVKGDIICKNLDIEGKFVGKIEVAELLSIKSKASIQGEITVGKLSVEPGAIFTASCLMKNPLVTISVSDAEKQQK